VSDVTPPALRDYYRFVKTRPCSACGKHGPCDAAHVRVLRSAKTGALLPRSHKGRAAWGCIPLCRDCHNAQHEMGEAQFAVDRELNYGQLVATLLVAHFTED
jgi:5-methylcytosine-specific restriction endonuclease McrA